jgi:hypothetical protein
LSAQLIIPALVNRLFGPNFAAKIEGPIPKDKVDLRILTPASVRVKPCYCGKEKRQCFLHLCSFDSMNGIGLFDANY